ncbi:MAG: hypothetical protein DRO87_07615, partial [Candidatus Thorarchaeota archaeon]
MLMEDLAQTALDAALKAGATFADIRIENTTTTLIELNDGVTKQALVSRLKGAGIRAFVDGAWAFAQTTDMTRDGLRTTGESVARLAVATKDRVREKFSIDGPTFEDTVEMKVKKSFFDVSIDEKMEFAKMVDDQARDFD